MHHSSTALAARNVACHLTTAIFYEISASHKEVKSHPGNVEPVERDDDDGDDLSHILSTGAL
jgi:hypothetical protein